MARTKQHGWMDGWMARWEMERVPKRLQEMGGRLQILAGRLEASKIVTHDFTTHINSSMPKSLKINPTTQFFILEHIAKCTHSLLSGKKKQKTKNSVHFAFCFH